MEFSDILLINNSIKLNHDEQKVLNLIYTPICGLTGMAIYNVLTSLKPNRTFKAALLYDLLQISKKDFIFYRKKLEAIGLLKTFYLPPEGYTFDLYKPNDLQSIINDALFISLLNSITGREEEIITQFKKELKKAKGTDISAVIEDTFKVEILDENNFDALFQTNDKAMINVSNKIVKEDIFQHLLKKEIDVILNNEAILESMRTKMFTYSFDIVTICEIFKKTLSLNKGYFNEKTFSELTSIKFTKTNSLIITKEVLLPEDVSLTFEQQYEKYQKLFQCNIAKFLKSVIKQYTVHDIEVVEKIIGNNPEVSINAIYGAVLLAIKNLGDNTLPAMAYLNKVVDDFKIAKMINDENAFDYFIKKITVSTHLQEKKKTTKTYHKKSNEVVDEPEFVTRFLSTLKGEDDEL